MREGVNRGTRQNTPSSSRRRRDQIQVCDESKGIGAKTEAEEEEEEDEEDGDRYGETPKGTPVEVIRVGGGRPPSEEITDLLDFAPEREHLLLREVYIDFPHHNNRSHLDRGVAEDSIWWLCWS